MSKCAIYIFCCIKNVPIFATKLFDANYYISFNSLEIKKPLFTQALFITS